MESITVKIPCVPLYQYCVWICDNPNLVYINTYLLRNICSAHSCACTFPIELHLKDNNSIYPLSRTRKSIIAIELSIAVVLVISFIFLRFLFAFLCVAHYASLQREIRYLLLLAVISTATNNNANEKKNLELSMCLCMRVRYEFCWFKKMYGMLVV